MITMILNISSDYCDRYLVIYDTEKISVFPKFTISPVLFSLWTFAKYHFSAHHFSKSLIPLKRYIAMETTKIHAYDPEQSQNHGSMQPPQRYSSLAPVCPHEVSTSCTSEPILNNTSCHIRYGELFLRFCSIHNIAHVPLLSAGKLSIPVHRTEHSSFYFS